MRIETECDHASRSSIRHLPVRVRLVRIWLIFPGLLLCALSGWSALAQAKAKNVLFVFSSLAQQRRDLDLFESALRARFPQHLNFYTSYVDYERMGDAAYQDSLAETFHYAYKNVKLDVAVVSAIEALGFITTYRDKILPGVPIVFYALSAKELEGLPMPAGVTGRTSDVGLRETIDLALRLHRDAQAVAIVTESPGFWWNVAHSELYRLRDRVREIDLFGPPGTDLMERIAALPPHTLILFQLAPLSGKESDISSHDVLAVAARHLPTYCAWKSELNYGCVGGAYVDWERYVAATAEIAARVLGGERPEQIPITDDSNFQTQVDWRELQRWDIPESALPSGTVVLYREPSLWERYKSYIIPAIAVIVAQSVLIAALLWQRSRKQKAEAILRESESRFRLMADTMPALVWMCDAQGKVTYLNDRRIWFTGRDTDAGYGDAWTTYIHPDDQSKVSHANSRALESHQPFAKEYRLRRRDGVYRWMLDVASPRVNGNGSFAGFIGAAIDTTDQKLAQQALEKVSGQLIEAQEKERRRIARDLHDDISQRLALLSMQLEQAARGSNVSAASGQNLEEIQQLCAEIANDVQSLSHQLHSSKLDLLGIVAAINGFCGEFSKQHEVSVEFHHRNLPNRLPRDVSLCLFRIVQEALHNAVKYSGETRFAVELSATAEDIQLAVNDGGAGFDVEEARKNRGLGLLSMQERTHLVRGTFFVSSKPGQGTRILVRVPLTSTDGASSGGKAAERVTVTG